MVLDYATTLGKFPWEVEETCTPRDLARYVAYRNIMNRKQAEEAQRHKGKVPRGGKTKHIIRQM